MRMIDLTGLTFNRWTVIARAENTKGGQARWLCRCECGTERELKSILIRRGTSKSCGCYKRETRSAYSTKHGHSKANGKWSGTYTSWAGIIGRCTQPGNRAWKDYGGRGITVCERWRDFRNFLEDMGDRPEGKYSIDRYPDNDGNYEPGNCRWATTHQQANNTRTVKNATMIEYNGRSQTIAAWANELDMKVHTIYNRLRIGWSVERALTEPEAANVPIVPSPPRKAETSEAQANG